MTRLFRIEKHNEWVKPEMMLANDEADAKVLTKASGRCPEGTEYELVDETANALGNETVVAMMEANKRGLLYNEGGDVFTCIRLSSECSWLHQNATQLVECPRCGARKRQPCNDEHHRIREGTAHRVRVRMLVKEHPEVLEHEI